MPTIHVFVGSFSDSAAARRYSEPQWEPEPDPTVSDEEYSVWEDRNPTWELRSELGVYLDSDFIETIDGSHRFDYLASQIVDKTSVDHIRDQFAATTNTLVLVCSEAFGGFPGAVKSTSRLIYCGEYEFIER